MTYKRSNIVCVLCLLAAACFGFQILVQSISVINS